jgi:hypothetical protein
MVSTMSVLSTVSVLSSRLLWSVPEGRQVDVESRNTFVEGVARQRECSRGRADVAVGGLKSCVDLRLRDAWAWQSCLRYGQWPYGMARGYLTANGRVRGDAMLWCVSARGGRYVERDELRKMRQAAGLTQREAADVCEVDIRSYQRWELGERRVRRIYLDRLAARRKPK